MTCLVRSSCTHSSGYLLCKGKNSAARSLYRSAVIVQSHEIKRLDVTEERGLSSIYLGTLSGVNRTWSCCTSRITSPEQYIRTACQWIPGDSRAVIVPSHSCHAAITILWTFMYAPEHTASKDSLTQSPDIQDLEYTISCGDASDKRWEKKDIVGCCSPQSGSIRATVREGQ